MPYVTRLILEPDKTEMKMCSQTPAMQTQAICLEHSTLECDKMIAETDNA
jgi:hypothetical protein